MHHGIGWRQCGEYLRSKRYVSILIDINLDRGAPNERYKNSQIQIRDFGFAPSHDIDKSDQNIWCKPPIDDFFYLGGGTSIFSTRVRVLPNSPWNRKWSRICTLFVSTLQIVNFRPIKYHNFGAVGVENLEKLGFFEKIVTKK